MESIFGQYYPIAWFFVGTVPFYFAVQRPPSFVRHALIAANILCILIWIRGMLEVMVPVQRAVAHGGIIISVHTISFLVFEKGMINTAGLSLNQRLRSVFRVWANVRRLDLTNQALPSPRTRVLFLVKDSIQLLLLLAIHHLSGIGSAKALHSLKLTMYDYGPANQTLLPAIPLESRDLILRSLTSVRWILESYIILTTAHTIFAIVFVSILGWDLPSSWPWIFGNPIEAYTLRRFWGIFWHRLTVPVANMYITKLAHLVFPDSKRGRSALRAAGIFAFSAVCHAIVNWIMVYRSNIWQELRFFLVNFAVCMLETQVGMGKAECGKGAVGWGRRLLGYVWVCAVFFTLAPTWQYSAISPGLGF
ncbi:membrane bound O-acyl transferase family-domain-containing protein [Echria macrotheca]|uniref:Membrane bound O-acyl transferase family-domain-containing protein n=1 Tax=Echria macrotheca TaxID=438768 RepID=A0AAJ0B4H3_9PEZI|nr:membrane bound O-acyl transferase family-domain-containing protein [Echria macrotheca]